MYEHLTYVQSSINLTTHSRFLVFTAFGVFIYDKFINVKQERQCTYNVTFRRVRATTVAVEKQETANIMSVCL